MVAAVHTAEREVGTPTYEPTAKEMQSRGFRRSLFVVEDVHAGEAFSERNVRSIRPAGGLHTRHYEEILGRRAACEIARGTPLCWDLVAPGRVTPES
jgi:sialic acid synthase SpsE